MRLFDKLFKNLNIQSVNTSLIDNTHNVIEDELTNKIKCQKCDSYVDINSKYCWKCGNIMSNSSQSDDKIQLKELAKEKIKEESTKETKEQIKYIMPSLDILKNEKLKENLANLSKTSGINVPIGNNSSSEVQYYDITKMPNLLVGGTVMSGKTNFMNNLICSITMCYSPEDVKISICDSKGVDYTCYNGIPHLLYPVIKNVEALKMLLDYEMNEIKRRYEILNEFGLKKLTEYNNINENEKMPFHVVFIDDYTVFANNDENDCNNYIEYIAKNGWNVGIHLIVVANHPTVKVLSAISLLNFPSRLSFRVPSNKDSRMILDAPGAEKITGIGNALINTPLIGKVEKISIDLIDDEDILAVVKNLKENNYAVYIDISKKSDKYSTCEKYDDPMYDEVVEFCVTTGKVSASLLQRRFKFGYERAARIVDLLEERGIVGPPNGSKPREVLVK